MKRSRAAITTAITRIYNFCNESDASQDEEQIRATRAADLFTEYEKIQQQIDEAIPSDEVVDETYRIEMKEKFYHIKAKA